MATSHRMARLLLHLNWCNWVSNASITERGTIFSPVHSRQSRRTRDIHLLGTLLLCDGTRAHGVSTWRCTVRIRALRIFGTAELFRRLVIDAGCAEAHTSRLANTHDTDRTDYFQNKTTHVLRRTKWLVTWSLWRRLVGTETPGQ